MFFLSGCKHKETWKPQPPFAGLEQNVSTFQVSTESDTIITLASGTKISIPKGIFAFADGSPVSGEVELLYREFHDGLDIFLAGIPMDYSSMGEKRTMQTAGMFEIDAKKDGKPLKLISDSKIDIAFGSKYQGENYSFFYLNPESGGWEWVDMPEYEVNAEKVAALENLQKISPKLYMGEDFFVLNYNRFLDVYLKDDWEKIYKLRESKTIKKKLEEYKVRFNDLYADGELVFGKSYYHPAEMLWKDLDGKDFPRWLKKFEPEWKKTEKGRWYISNYNFKSLGNNTYETSYVVGGKKFTKRLEAVIPLKNLLKLPAAEWQSRYDEAMKQLAEEQSKIDLMAESFRSFSVNRLGTYNFDCLLKQLNEWFEIVPEFSLNGNSVLPNQVIILLGDNSGYISISADKLKTMRINPASKHRIIAFLPENTMGVFPVSKLDSIHIADLNQNEKPAINFDLVSYQPTDAVALREFLGFD